MPQSLELNSNLHSNSIDNPNLISKENLANSSNLQPNSQKVSDYQKGLQYLNLAKRLYHQNLLKILENPNHFVSIYCQKRGLTLEIIQKFEIGFASPNCDILRLAKKYNLDRKILFQTGLLKKIDKKT